MKPTWIIENFSKEESYTDLIKEAKNQGFDVVQVFDYNKESLKACLKTDCVIFNGSIQMTEILKKDLNWCGPVAYCTLENYLCSKYYPYFGKFLFNDKYAFIPLKDLIRQKFLFYGIFGKEALLFIRPDSGQKTFQAQLLDLLDLDRFGDTNKDIDKELVLVSTPKNIIGEYRFVCSKYKEIIAHSTYRYQNQITKIQAVPAGATQKVKEILEVGYYPDSVFCVDICDDSDGNFYLLELNSFSSAGLYACNKEKIVKRVSEIAVEDYKKV